MDIGGPHGKVVKNQKEGEAVGNAMPNCSVNCINIHDDTTNETSFFCISPVVRTTEQRINDFFNAYTAAGAGT